MKTALQYKLLQQLRQRQKNAGFTLIELLVVVIIVGILAAVALPNLLGQVGKARETELKNAVGTVNRSQQAYHFEKQLFTQGGATADPDKAQKELGISLPTEYMSSITITADGGDSATVAPKNDNATNDGTRAYSGGIFYATGNYTQIVCQSNKVATDLAAPTSADPATGCAADSKNVR